MLPANCTGPSGGDPTAFRPDWTFTGQDVHRNLQAQDRRVREGDLPLHRLQRTAIPAETRGPARTEKHRANRRRWHANRRARDKRS